MSDSVTQNYVAPSNNAMQEKVQHHSDHYSRDVRAIMHTVAKVQ